MLFDEAGDLADTGRRSCGRRLLNVDPVRDVVTRGERAVIDASDKKVAFPVAGAWPDAIS